MVRKPVLVEHFAVTSMAHARKASRRGRSRHSRARTTRGRRKPQMLFKSTNYLLMLVGVLAIVVGYAIMRIENEVDGFISLYVAPLLILGGYLEIIYAILWRSKGERATGDANRIADT